MKININSPITIFFWWPLAVGAICAATLMLIGIVALIHVLVAGVASAKDGERLIAGEMACVSDWQKYCSEYGVDRIAIRACFVAHKDQVSAACMEVVRKYRKPGD
jgi:hypothetical protein